MGGAATYGSPEQRERRQWATANDALHRHHDLRGEGGDNEVQEYVLLNLDICGCPAVKGEVEDSGNGSAERRPAQTKMRWMTVSPSFPARFLG